MTAIRTVNLNDQRPKPVWPSKAERKGTIAPGILAFDPGETTGWSYIQPKLLAGQRDSMSVSVEEIEYHSHGEIDCGARQGALLTDDEDDPGLNPSGEALGVGRMIYLCDLYPNAVIVVEDFIVDFGQITKARAAVSPLRITARLEQELWQRNRSIILQDRANPKASMNDKRLKEFGRYQRVGGLKHARDADRHGLYWLRRCQNSAELRHRSWPWLFEAPIAKKTKPRKPRTPGQRINFA